MTSACQKDDPMLGDALQGIPRVSTSPSPMSSRGSTSSPTPRRQLQRLPPSSIPNFSGISSFPSATEARTPVPPVFSPSPNGSPTPASSSPTRSPVSTPLHRPAQLHNLRDGLPQPSAQHPASHSPWALLAAQAGAPTPSLETGPRDSPLLGRPFEDLIIGNNTWSASNFEQTNNAQPSALSSSSPMSLPPGSLRLGKSHPFAPTGPSSRMLQRQDSAPALSSTAVDLSAKQCSGSLVGNIPSHLCLSSLSQRRISLPQLDPMPPNRAAAFGNVSASSPVPSSRIQPLSAVAVPELAAAKTTLVLDVRPPSLFQASHFATARSLSIPSTLLRRPAFNLAKVCQMLSPESQGDFSRWRDMTDIILIDQESPAAPDGTVLNGLATKFEREGFEGRLWFVRGGHAALLTSNVPNIISSLDQETPDNLANPASSQPAPQSNGRRDGLLTVGQLPKLAFQEASTSIGSRSALPATAALGSHGDPFHQLRVDLPETAGGSMSRQSSRGPSRARLQPANPFFDNIRQNIELSHGGITERIPLSLPESTIKRAADLPKFLADLVTMPDKESMDLLAQQFYSVELGEQRRLQSVMDFLARPSNDPSCAVPKAGNCEEVAALMSKASEDVKQGGSATYFPFSITAGVERGTKNRYKDIWPYDFARVRLGTPTDDDSDYINASFVQPKGTTRRYIATQGPLDATYRDFWTLIWEQGVRVIVMVTKQYEGGLYKCGKYWAEQSYGDLHLKLVSETRGDERDKAPETGFDFMSGSKNGSKLTDGNIKRVFQLRHSGYPNEPRREIVQVQCVDWPDLDVPDTPDVLLNLIRDVDSAVEEMCEVASGDDRCTQPPVLVHCSAGVGRTGSFILVDSVIDGIRRERAKETGQASSRPVSANSNSHASVPKDGSRPEDTNMDVDDTAHSGEDRDQTDIGGAPGYATDENGNGVGVPRPVTSSHHKHRTPTPLSRFKEPIVTVLQDMRVQRMSLVQSLRQYIFVHRAIIASCLDMVDKETSRSAGAEASTALAADVEDGHTASSPSASAPVVTPLSAGSPLTVVTSPEDEGHVKRKPSATELHPEVFERERPLRKSATGPFTSPRSITLPAVEGITLDGQSDLVKRLSFKRRRSALKNAKGSGESPTMLMERAQSAGAEKLT